MIQRGTAPSPSMIVVTDDRLARAVQTILERSSEPFTIEPLPSTAGMSRSSFAARFTSQSIATTYGAAQLQAPAN